MNAHIMITVAHAIIKAVNTKEFPTFCSLILENASAKLQAVKEGQILLQSFGHYIAHFNLFECLVDKEITANLAIIESCFIMRITLTGQSSLYNSSKQVVSETLGNSCALSHFTTGTYDWTLQPGKHKLLLLTFHPGWFMRNSEPFAKLALLTENYLTIKEPECILPHCAITNELFKKFEGIKHEINEEHKTLSNEVYNFIQHCLDYYRKQYYDDNYDLNTIYKMKVSEIVNYINLNYADEMLNSDALLAKEFNISVTSMRRYFKQIRGESVHEYIISVRMDNAVTLLKTTILPIKDIAARAGYSSAAYFSSAFKKLHKKAPSEVSRPIL